MRPIDADGLKEYFFRPYSNEECYTNVDIEEIIDRQPTIEQINWIPCSERLPEKSLRVLMQLNNAWQIVGWYDKADKQWYALPSSQEVVNDVLAWMPLPKDYEPQSELPSYVAEIEEEYQKAVRLPHIHKPLAKALYEVWKKHDKEDVN